MSHQNGDSSPFALPLVEDAQLSQDPTGYSQLRPAVQEGSDVISAVFRNFCDEEAVNEIPGRKACPHGVE